MQKHEPSVESLLVEWVQEFLDVDDISPSDDFLRLGGASIAAARLTIQIEEHFDIEFPLVYLFEFPSLAELASAVEKLVEAREDQDDRRSTGDSGSRATSRAVST